MDKFIKNEITDLLDVSSGLTDWEVSFVEDIFRELSYNKILSFKQVTKVHELWDKHCV